MAYTFGRLPDLEGSFIITDEKGNYFYGYLNHRQGEFGYIFRSYSIVGANYDGHTYSYDSYKKVWKRSGLGGISPSFKAWFEKGGQPLRDYLPNYFQDRY